MTCGGLEQERGPRRHLRVVQVVLVDASGEDRSPSLAQAVVDLREEPEPIDSLRCGDHRLLSEVVCRIHVLPSHRGARDHPSPARGEIAVARGIDFDVVGVEDDRRAGAQTDLAVRLLAGVKGRDLPLRRTKGTTRPGSQVAGCLRPSRAGHVGQSLHRRDAGLANQLIPAAKRGIDTNRAEGDVEVLSWGGITSGGRRPGAYSTLETRDRVKSSLR